MLSIAMTRSVPSGKRTSHSHSVRHTDGVQDQGLNCRGLDALVPGSWEGHSILTFLFC